MTTATRLFDTVEYPSLTQEGGKSNEWYTPSRYIEAAREVMGGIDLDPASCELANRTVKAARYYSKEDDGLSKEWYGRVWLNCPFSDQAEWAKKTLKQYQQGSIKSCIFLAQSATERNWFQPLWWYPICFTNHQIIFNRPNDKPYHIYHGTCFVYLGPNESRFIEVFSQFGRIVKAIDTPRQPVVPLSLWDEV